MLMTKLSVKGIGCNGPLSLSLSISLRFDQPSEQSWCAIFFLVF